MFEFAIYRKVFEMTMVGAWTTFLITNVIGYILSTLIVFSILCFHVKNDGFGIKVVYIIYLLSCLLFGKLVVLPFGILLVITYLALNPSQLTKNKMRNMVNLIKERNNV